MNGQVELKILYIILNDNFQAYRSNCGMKCVKFGRCRHCLIYADLADENIINKMKQHIEN